MALNSKRNVRKNTVENVQEVVLNGVLKVVNNHDEDTWVGTMTELNSALVRVLGRKAATALPASPSALRVVLNGVVNKLRNRKVGVKFLRSTDRTRTRLVRFTL